MSTFGKGSVWSDQIGVERGVAVDAPLVLTSDDAFRQWAANRICELLDQQSVLNEKLDRVLEILAGLQPTGEAK